MRSNNRTLSNLTVRLVVAEDHSIVRAALVTVFAQHPHLKVVGEVEDGHQLMDEIARTQPDILLMDLKMPNLQPVRAVCHIHTHFSKVQVIILSAYDRRDYVLGLLSAGVAGYVLKGDPADHLIQAISAVHQGLQWFSPAIRNTIVSALHPEEQNIPLDLTQRQQEILRLLAQGHSNREIGETLTITQKTVKNHLTRIFMRMGVEKRTEAVSLATGMGLIAPERPSEWPQP